MLRALLLIAHLAWGLLVCLSFRLSPSRHARREQIAQSWHRRLLDILVMRVTVEGRPCTGAHLTAANHVSWLDIPVLGALEPTRFVAKSEVRDWPVAGTLASAAGTFYIQRGKGGSGPVLEQLIPHLRAGGAVALFPEGTTTDGTSVRPFHARLFSAAIEARCPVQPVTIHYALTPEGENVAPFIGDDALVPHIVRILRNPGIDVRVIYGPPLDPGTSRDAVAEEAEDFVRSALPEQRWPVSFPLQNFPDLHAPESPA